jgi:hypothetical protein
MRSILPTHHRDRERESRYKLREALMVCPVPRAEQGAFQASGEAWIAYNKTSDVSPCALQFSAVVFSFVTFVDMNSSRSEPLKGRGLEVW